MSGGVVRRDPRQTPDRDIKHCPECATTYVIKQGAALPCTHNKGGEQK